MALKCFPSPLFFFSCFINCTLLTPVLPFSPHRSSRLSQSSTPCSTSIGRFCVKARLQPSPSPLCPCSSWNKPLTTTPLSSARTCPAPPRSAAAERLPLVAVSHAPPPTPSSPREDSISSWHRPTSSTSMPPLPRLPPALHPHVLARHHCVIPTIITTIITPTIITPRLRPPHLKVAPMRLWEALHPSSPQTVSAVAVAEEIEGFLFWRGFHHHPLPAEAGARTTCHERLPQKCPPTWRTFVEV